MKNSKDMKTLSHPNSTQARPAGSLLSRYSRDYYRDDYVVNSVHVVECDSIDAEPCSNGKSSHKLSAMRRSPAKPESMSLDMNNIIQISISAEQSPDPVDRTDPKKNFTPSDSMSPNIKEIKQGKEESDQLEDQNEEDKVFSDDQDKDEACQEEGRSD